MAIWNGGNLSVLDIHPKVKLLTGAGVPPTLELDSSFAAFIFIGQHSMAGAKKGVLSHSNAPEGIQNILVNGRPTGEICAEVMLAGTFDIPVIMLSGDTAACQELHELVREARCAEVKKGVSRTAALMLSHPSACALIREKARDAMEHLSSIKPYVIAGPVEVKVEYTPVGTKTFPRQEGVEQLNDRTWVFRGNNIRDAWLKFSSF
jgi:D-amino peptidase